MILSPEQQSIINSKKNTIVISNPGTGKTTTLALKVIKLLREGAVPEKILCITFTEKAKKEMFDKIYELSHGKFSDSEIMKINIHTFHSFAYNYLLDSGLITGDIVGNNALRFSLLKSFEKSKAFNYGKEYIISDIVPKTENAIRYIKSFGLTPDKIEAKKVKAAIEDLYEDKKTSYSLEELQAFVDYFIKAYKDYEVSKNDSVDYSDMLLMFIDKFRSDKFDHVLVDEMQDMNGLEAKIAEMVGKNIFLVGDAKQAIFGFQGGSIGNFSSFMKKCDAKLLSENRRSCQQILDYSKNHFLNTTKNKEIFIKELECFKSEMKGVAPKVISTKAHLSRIMKIIDENQKKTIGVITRTNRQLIEVSQFLDMNNIEYSSTTSQATAQQARTEIITFLKGLLSNKTEDRIQACFTLFSPYSLREAFEISDMFSERKDVSAKLNKLNDTAASMNRTDLDRIFNKIILPLCISKGQEWFSTGIIVRHQIEEYLKMELPTIQGLFDFISITEESYRERAAESRIMLTTVHKAKGRGFDIVVYLPTSGSSRTGFIDILVEAILDSQGIDIKEELEEESLRIDFVAFTRAKEKLFIITDQKGLKSYHVQDFSEIETDEKEEDLIETKLDSRTSEAFSLFLAGRLDDSRKLLKAEESWLEEFINDYFRSLDTFSYSMITTDPYDFLISNIISMPVFFEAASFGSKVHNALADIFSGKKVEMEADVKRAVDNGLKAMEQLKKDLPGLKQLYSEKRMLVPMTAITDCNDKKLMFKGFVDAVFKYDGGYAIIDYKTDKNISYANEHKRQLAVYRKMLSVLEKVPENHIKIFILYVSLRGGINTGRFDWAIEAESRNPFPTFEKHLQKVLEWKKNPKSFIKELLEAGHDDVLFEAIRGKLNE